MNNGRVSLSCANPGDECTFWGPVRGCTEEDRVKLERQKREVGAGFYNYYREEEEVEVESEEEEEESEEERDVGEFEFDTHGFENRPWDDYNETYMGTEEDESDGERDPYEGSRHKINRWQGRGFALGL